MGRAPCCDKNNVKRGPWSPEEDAKLKAYIEQYGTGGNWIALPQKIGLKRCGKSCRLRWLNYLRPNIKHGGFSEEEDNIICSLYISIGSRWSIIAAQLPGRTDNDVKNYWNTRLKKKLLGRARKQSNMNNNNNLSSNEGLSSSALERLQLHLQLQNPNSSSSIHHSLIQSSCSTAVNNPHLMQQLAAANLVNNNGQTNYLHILQQQIFQAPAVINPNYDHGLVSPNYSSTTTANTTEILVDPTAPNGHFNDQDAPAAASLLMTPIYSNKSAAAAAAAGNDLGDHEFDCFKQVISTDIVDDIVDNINGTTSSKEDQDQDQEQEQEEESFMWWSNNSTNMDQFFQPRSSAAASASASNSWDQGTGMFQDYAGHHELGANIYM